MMEDRTSPIPVAVSRDKSGTDVNFGALTRKLFNYLEENNVQVEYEHQVLDIKQQKTVLGKLKSKIYLQTMSQFMNLILYLSVQAAQVYHFSKKQISKNLNTSADSQSAVFS